MASETDPLVAASEKTSLEVDMTGMNDFPLHLCGNALHHIKSAHSTSIITIYICNNVRVIWHG